MPSTLRHYPFATQFADRDLLGSARKRSLSLGSTSPAQLPQSPFPDNFRFASTRELNENDSVARALCFGVRICYSRVRKRTSQINLSHTKSFTMWRLVLASVMLVPRQGESTCHSFAI